MTERQITSRLSTLAGKIALQVLGLHDQHPVADLAGTDVPQRMYESYMEFSSLVMGTMVWHNSKFRSIINTNLDTQVGSVLVSQTACPLRNTACKPTCVACTCGSVLPAIWLIDIPLWPSGYRVSAWTAQI